MWLAASQDEADCGRCSGEHPAMTFLPHQQAACCTGCQTQRRSLGPAVQPDPPSSYIRTFSLPRLFSISSKNTIHQTKSNFINNSQTQINHHVRLHVRPPQRYLLLSQLLTFSRRKGLGEQAQEKITPDSQKSTTDKIGENVSGATDKVAGALQPGKTSSSAPMILR